MCNPPRPLLIPLKSPKNRRIFAEPTDPPFLVGVLVPKPLK